MTRKQKLIAGTFLGLLVSFEAFSFETTAKNAILVDYETGAYIYTKDHDKKMAPASMSKLMTLYVVFDKIKNGSLSLDDTFEVSENAWRKGGAASGSSTMFLKIGEKVRVEDLIKGIIIQSGNDACITIAENIAGTEEDFAVLMNETAEKIGLNNSSFANSTGWPHPEHKMSAEDLAKLSKFLIEDFGEFYHLFSQKEFTHNGIKQGNRNPLLYSMESADGLKTGHTDEAGFCLAASATKNGRRLIGVMSGMNSNKERSEEAEKLINYGFREFDNYKIFKKGDKFGTAKVWYGMTDNVDLVTPYDVLQTIKRNLKNKYELKVSYKEPIKAPIKKGDKIGKITLISPEGDKQYFPLVANADVKQIGVFKKFVANLKYLLLGNK
ncbi:MAG: D-alanyl-D-alanine carboxypeptidase [Alphaproteobacteria bacterium]|nr:D-alanyl-D-alanine carboxypeptidase [Alphaproteobacteria bacterium]